MSTQRNPLAVRSSNAFTSHKDNRAAPKSKTKTSARSRQSEDDENIDTEGEVHASRAAATKSAAAAKKSRTHERSTDDIDMLKQQFLKEMNDQKKDKARLGDIGRILCRTYSPFHDLSDPLHLALKRRSGARLDKEQRTSADLGDTILDAFEDLRALISKHGLLYVESQITQARNDVRATDTLKIRRGIMQWHNWGIPQESLNDKSKRGWAHEEMAQLLFPDHLVFSFTGAQMYLDGKHAVNEKEIPCLVYADGVGNDVSGFLRGAYLFRGGEAILQGAQAPVTGARASTNTAKKHHITTVNETFIIYVICLVRFALSGEESFTPDGGQGFNYLEFFDTMQNEIDNFKAAGSDGAGEAAMQDIIEHWNKYIFRRRKPVVLEDDPELLQAAAEYRADRKRKWAVYAENCQREREAAANEDSDDGDAGHVPSPREPARPAKKGGVPLFLEDDANSGAGGADEGQDDGNEVQGGGGSDRGSTSRRGRPGSRALHSPAPSVTPTPRSPPGSSPGSRGSGRGKRGKARK